MLKHNKKKNAYIVLEQLLSIMTRLAAQNKQNEAKFLLSVIKEHYNKKTVLSKEKQLFESLLKLSDLSEKDAEDILQETLSQASKINPKELEIAKANLINDISKRIDKDLFSVPVKDYKLMASAQMMFNEARNNENIITPVEKNKLKKMIIKNLTKKTVKEDKHEIDNFTFKVLLNKYNKKYTDIINEHQKEVLKSWTIFTVDGVEENIKPILEQKLNLIEKTLGANFDKKSDIQPMLQEAYGKVKNKKIEKIDENLIYEVMRYLDLVEDLS